MRRCRCWLRTSQASCGAARPSSSDSTSPPACAAPNGWARKLSPGYAGRGSQRPQDKLERSVSMGTDVSKVTVRFFDDETLEGRPQDIDFDEADFLLHVEDPSGLDNNELAWIPLSAVKWVEFPQSGDGASESPTRKVAIRFLDGEVLRGHIDGGLQRHRYGIV